ncbi:MAG: hypothetical protein M3R57_12120 [Chloroflexota bacterium]|nr:hypothetical protein [Chloroflexota bacterium]
MDPAIQQNLVNTHIAGLEAEAAAERLALAARVHHPKPSRRAALGQRLIAIGEATAATPVDEPCPDTGAGNPA